MDIYHSLTGVAMNREAAVTIGNFDGVHRGHQHIIQSMVEAANAAGRQPVLITFYPNPKAFNSKSKFVYLTSNSQKMDLIQKLGVETMIVLEFNRELMHIRAEEFIRLLISNLAMRELWIGYDFQFGYQREGNASLLSRVGNDLGFIVNVMAPVLSGGLPISSSRIRDAIRSGDHSLVRSCLGRSFRKESVYSEDASYCSSRVSIIR